LFAVVCFVGVVGILLFIMVKLGLLVGVFISVIIIFVVGTFVVCMACGIWFEVGLVLAQLGLNLFGIIFAGIIILCV